jgi:hypothetical protein
MARKTTIISTVTGSDGGGGGVVLLSAVGVALGILAIDHHYAPRGTSAWHGIKRSLGFTKDAPSHWWAAGQFAGLDAPWSEMTGKVSVPFQPFLQQVIQKAMTTEDAATLQQLAANLAAAGLNQIADAVRQAGSKK